MKYLDSCRWMKASFKMAALVLAGVMGLTSTVSAEEFQISPTGTYQPTITPQDQILPQDLSQGAGGEEGALDFLNSNPLTNAQERSSFAEDEAVRRISDAESDKLFLDPEEFLQKAGSNPDVEKDKYDRVIKITTAEKNYQYEYDSDDKIIKARQSDRAGTPEFEYSYEYDQNGKLTVIKEFKMQLTDPFNIAKGIIGESSSSHSYQPGIGGAVPPMYHFKASRATDGLYGDSDDPFRNAGWVASYTDEDPYLQLDFGEVKTVNRLLYDNRFPGVNRDHIWQEDFSISGSLDGVNWFKLVRQEGLASGSTGVFEFNIQPEQLRFIRAHDFKIRTQNLVPNGDTLDQDQNYIPGGGYSLEHLKAYVAELEVYEERYKKLLFSEYKISYESETISKIEKDLFSDPSKSNIALGVEPQVSYQFVYMPAKAATDGKFAEQTSTAWLDNTSNPDAFLQLDFQSTKTIDQINLDIRRSFGGMGDTNNGNGQIVSGFTLSGSLDGQNWFVIAERSDLTQGSQQIHRLHFDPVEVRYVKVHEFEGPKLVMELEVYESTASVQSTETVYDATLDPYLPKYQEVIQSLGGNAFIQKLSDGRTAVYEMWRDSNSGLDENEDWVNLNRLWIFDENLRFKSLDFIPRAFADLDYDEITLAPDKTVRIVRHHRNQEATMLFSQDGFLITVNPQTGQTVSTQYVEAHYNEYDETLGGYTTYYGDFSQIGINTLNRTVEGITRQLVTRISVPSIFSESFKFEVEYIPGTFQIQRAVYYNRNNQLVLEAVKNTDNPFYTVTHKTTGMIFHRVSLETAGGAYFILKSLLGLVDQTAFYRDSIEHFYDFKQGPTFERLAVDGISIVNESPLDVVSDPDQLNLILEAGNRLTEGMDKAKSPSPLRYEVNHCSSSLVSYHPLDCRTPLARGSDGTELLFADSGKITKELLADDSFNEYFYKQDGTYYAYGDMDAKGYGTYYAQEPDYFSEDGRILGHRDENETIIKVGYPDEGFATIQEAVAFAPEGSVIQIAAGTYIVAGFALNKNNLTFRGDDSAKAGEVVIDNNFTIYRHFSIPERVNVTFENLTFKNGGRGNGSQDFGGSFNIQHAANVYFKNCVFDNNFSQVLGAGALHIWGGNVTVEDSLFKNNYANYLEAEKVYQSVGAIYISGGTLIVRNTVFDSNGGHAGVIKARDHAQVTVDHSLMININSAIAAMIIDDGSTLTISNSAFINNTSTGGGIPYIRSLYPQGVVITENNNFYETHVPALSPIADVTKPDAMIDFSDVSTAKGYQIQISATSDFSQIVHDSIVTASKLDFPALDYGNYFVRVRSVWDPAVDLRAVSNWSVSAPMKVILGFAEVLSERNLQYFDDRAVNPALNSASGYPTEGYLQQGFTQPTAIGYFAQFLGNIISQEMTTAYVDRSEAVLALEKMVNSLDADQTSVGYLGLFPWMTFNGSSRTRAIDGTYGVPVAYAGDNANLAVALASAIGAVPDSALNGLTAAEKIKVQTARTKMETILNRMEAGFTCLYSSGKGQMSRGMKINDTKNCTTSLPEFVGGHHSVYHDEFREGLAFVAVRYAGVPDQIYQELDVRIKPYTLGSGASSQQVFTVAPYDGGAFQMLWPGISTPETEIFQNKQMLENFVKIALDYSQKNNIPGFLSASYERCNQVPLPNGQLCDTGDANILDHKNEYAENAGITSLSSNGMPRDEYVASLYTLGAAMQLAPYEVEPFLYQIMQTYPGLDNLTHGVWEGFDKRQNQIVQHQVSSNVLTFALGAAGTGSQHMQNYLGATRYQQYLNLHPTGSTVDLVGASSNSYAYGAGGYGCGSAQCKSGDTFTVNAPNSTSVTMVFEQGTGVNISGRKLIFKYSSSQNVGNVWFEFKQNDEDGLNHRLEINSLSLSAATDKQMEIFLPATSALSDIEQIVMVLEGSGGAITFSIKELDIVAYDTVQALKLPAKKDTDGQGAEAPVRFSLSSTTQAYLNETFSDMKAEYERRMRSLSKAVKQKAKSKISDIQKILSQLKKKPSEQLFLDALKGFGMLQQILS